ncbi:hypothetical protein Aspvir_007016 [Aspergillus viridinutans]|uniref:FAD-binding domain-containing protein n=1 Tax=Aspergillus viridinutans TaxID=75553 RepID=A0A9P3F6F1_ASPVI|nr:uncharacterized protein Aspvir_007016 [Aspergillus viridinutans]GIK02951.1 hypothetical protein Aspvir_007016 [Aspergillus viridinutans]
MQWAVADITTNKINLWPFYVVPKLRTWSSGHSQVVILGDAAHAIPPSAGQGINQAFEDVFTYALILGRSAKESLSLQRALKIWQEGRQERVDKVLALNAQIDKRRMQRSRLIWNGVQPGFCGNGGRLAFKDGGVILNHFA